VRERERERESQQHQNVVDKQRVRDYATAGDAQF